MDHGDPKTPGKLSAAEFAFCALVAVGVTGLLALRSSSWSATSPDP